jgi:hypothetical protein
METRYPALTKGVRVLLVLAGLHLASPALAAQSLEAADKTGTARLAYTRVLKGSSPEYISVTVNANGSGTFDGRQLADPPKPMSFKLTAATAQRLFSLAAEMNNFQAIDLESHRNVANLGEKTFTYERDGKKSSATFNYTQRKEAVELSETFERIATVEEHVQRLQFAIKYDPLSLPGDLLRVQIDLANKALADPEMMVPTLEEIARNPRFMHLAQERAQDILQRVQNVN